MCNHRSNKSQEGWIQVIPKGCGSGWLRGLEAQIAQESEREKMAARDTEGTDMEGIDNELPAGSSPQA